MEVIELEKTIWATAKKLQNNVDFYEGAHIILGLVFLRYTTDTSEEPGESFTKENRVIYGNVDDREEHLTFNEFFVPRRARWTFLVSNAKSAEIGLLVDEVIEAIEKLNENIRGILPKNYSDQNIDKTVLGELIQLIGNIGVGQKIEEKKGLLTKVYASLLENFALAAKASMHFNAPQNVARLLVEMVGPRRGIIYDGSCGAGNMFVYIHNHVEKYRAKIDYLKFYGQDDNAILIKIAKMNLMIHDFVANLHVGNAFINDSYPDLIADFILASPPSNQRNWRGSELINEPQWTYGMPPAANGNYAWIGHYINKLSSTGIAGIILPEGSLDSNATEERKIRQALVEGKLVDCIITLPVQLYTNTEEPICLWILTKNKTNNKYTNPGDEVLFIDARKLKVTGDKELSDEALLLVSRSYQRWRNINGDYIDRKGFCRAVTINEISKNKYSLNPSTYVAQRRFRKVIPALFAGILVAGAAFLINTKNSSITTNHSAKDTALTIAAKPAKDTPAVKQADRTVRRKVKDRQVKEKDNSLTNAAQNKSLVRTSVVKKDSMVEKSNPEDRYQVISKAYFYNEPDERTRRNAFINHWNNSYAKIEAEDEKNGFIYVEFLNHLNQTSRGWLRKKDLRK